MTKKASLVVLVFCLHLGAQNDGAQCDGNPSPQPLVQQNIPRSAHVEWDAEVGVPSREGRMTADVISARALTHKPPKLARKEFNRGISGLAQATKPRGGGPS
jgi:hypothetical protein